ncbi:MATE family efflux transporter [Tabrizicola sp.]|uniref:MATE family efflux transporter n=1 Tax=Tabrizicola sp. TaxID=2005166 RepID=UPI003F2D1CCD
MIEITHGRVLRIAGPIVLSNITVPLLGAVDTGVIGQLGDPASLGAVGIGAVIITTFYWAFGFLRMSTSGLVAQAEGAGDQAERSAVLQRALVVGAAAGLALVAAQVALFAAAFAIAPASAEVERLAGQYLSIRIWGAPATIAIYALTGWLVGLGRTRGVLVLQLWQNGVNIGLDFWFVLGLGWGVPGVAASTLIAEWSGLALALWLTRDAFGPSFRAGFARLGDRVAIRRMFTTSRDIMGRTVILMLSFTAFVFLGARFGDVTLAANQVLMQFLEVTAFALDGFAFAAEALVGQAVGARSAAQTRAAGRICMQWGIGGAVGLAAIFAVTGPWVIDLLTTSPEVRAEARDYLPWLVAAPLIGVAAWIYDGIFIGALLTGDMLKAMLIAVAFYALALAVLVPLGGNHGLWAALMVLNAARTATLWHRYPKVLALAERR